MYREFIVSPHSFSWSDIVTTDIFLNFINYNLQLDSRVIRALVDVFINIFNYSDCTTNLYINIGFILLHEI
jgi:hypothetical protein